MMTVMMMEMLVMKMTMMMTMTMTTMMMMTFSPPCPSSHLPTELSADAALADAPIQHCSFGES